ncbi:hypothetical protein ACYULU_10955 [Breznakiellaceae bacterium SP9]
MKLVNINNSAPFGYAGLISDGGGSGKTARGAGRRVKLKPGTGLQTIFRCVCGACFFLWVLCGCLALLKWIGRAVASVQMRAAIATKNGCRARAAGVVAAIVMASVVLAACQTEASEPPTTEQIIETWLNEPARKKDMYKWPNYNPLTDYVKDAGDINKQLKGLSQDNIQKLYQEAMNYIQANPDVKNKPESELKSTIKANLPVLVDDEKVDGLTNNVSAPDIIHTIPLKFKLISKAITASKVRGA